MSVQAPDPRRHVIVVEHRVLGPEESIRIPARPPFDVVEGMYWEPRQIFCLSEVLIDPRTGLVFHQGRVVMESGDDYRFADDRAFLSSARFRIERPGKTRTEPRPVVPLGVVWNYYHFLIEAIPRVLHARRFEPDVTALFGATPPSWALSLLETLGIPHLVDTTTTVLASHAWICTPNPFQWPRPTDLEAILGSLPPTIGLPAAHGQGTRIVVSRAGANRAIANEHRLVDPLVSHGFAAVQLDTMSFRQQVELFSSAQTVVAEHGAGLANIAFMQPMTRVIEVTSGYWWTSSFRHIAAMRNLDYDLLVIPSSVEVPYGQGDDAYRVVAEALELD